MMANSTYDRSPIHYLYSPFYSFRSVCCFKEKEERKKNREAERKLKQEQDQREEEKKSEKDMCASAPSSKKAPSN